MSPRTIDGLAHGTALDGYITHGNPEFANVDRPTPTFAFGPGQAFYSGVLDSEAYSGQALGTASRGRILEFTYIEGQPPSHFWP